MSINTEKTLECGSWNIRVNTSVMRFNSTELHTQAQQQLTDTSLLPSSVTAILFSQLKLPSAIILRKASINFHKILKAVK